MYKTKPETGETLLAALRSLYEQYGYSRYKMNKFEEYDLYAHHKDFLISDRVLTFTDGSGKLLALKPDVTLSIVKSSQGPGQGTEKLYYNENVYRMARGSRDFKEIMQVGLECLGNVDDYCLLEVLSLALDSLAAAGESYVLSVSHLGVVNEAMDAAGVPGSRKADVLKCLENKNLHELTALLAALSVPADRAAVLKALLSADGKPASILPLLEGVCQPETVDRFRRVLAAFGDVPELQIDFSVVGDIHYYNGFIFKGFCEGIPDPVLSGGQYDTLMRKMGRRGCAVGFAVYLDVIEQYRFAEPDFDVDVLLLYPADCPPMTVQQAVKKITKKGESVLAQPAVPAGIRWRRCLRLENGEVIE